MDYQQKSTWFIEVVIFMYFDNYENWNTFGKDIEEILLKN